MWTCAKPLPAGEDMAEPLTFVTGNFYLTQSEQEGNVAYLWDWVQRNQPEWSMQAVAAMLGNMESESTINPGIWQSLQEPPFEEPDKHGYGLVQWTPYTKYTDWAADNGYQADSMDTALLRIVWEEENNEQYYATAYYDHPFSYFLRDTETPVDDLAEAFLRNYERPNDIPGTAPVRRQNALDWYAYLQTLPGLQPPKPKKGFKFIYYMRRF